MTPVDRQAVCELARQIGWRQRIANMLAQAIERSTRGEAVAGYSPEQRLADAIATAIKGMPLAEARAVAEILRTRMISQLASIQFPTPTEPE